MRVLLTGASGFVGRSALSELSDAGHDVVVVCRKPPQDKRDHLLWDLAEDAPRSAAIGNCEAMVHLAQSRSYRNFPEDAHGMFQINVGGTQRLLDFAVRTGIKRFCLISSGTVYEPFAGGLDEGAPLAPSSYLGASKLAAEIVARPYGKLLDLSILRLFTPYGPGQTDRLIPDIVERVRLGRPIQVTPDGHGTLLSPTYVDDIAQVIRTAIEQRWTGVINVAAPVEVSIGDLAGAIGRAVGILPHFECVAGAARRVVPNLERLARLFPLSHFRSLEAGLTATVKPPS